MSDIDALWQTVTLVPMTCHNCGYEALFRSTELQDEVNCPYGHGRMHEQGE